MAFETNFKPSRTARKKAEKKRKLERKAQEDQQMRAARRRDGVCRFPLCGCRKLGLQLEVSHALQHRGMGGNPAGDRTQTAGLILVCNHRHRFGSVSIDRGTLRVVPQTEDGCDGPVTWEMWVWPDTWVELAREDRPGHCVLTTLQANELAQLAEMER